MKRWATTDQMFAKTVSVLIVHLCNIWAKELANPFRRNLLRETGQALHLQRAKITLRHVAATIPWLWSTYRRRDEWGWLKTMFRCLPSRCFVHYYYVTSTLCVHMDNHCTFLYPRSTLYHLIDPNVILPIMGFPWHTAISLCMSTWALASSSRGSNLCHQGWTQWKELQLLINGTWVSSLQKVMESPAN